MTHPTTTSTSTTTPREDETISTPFWMFLLVGLAGAMSVIVGLLLWKSCCRKRPEETGIGGRGNSLQQNLRSRSVCRSHNVFPPNLASTAPNASDSDSDSTDSVEPGAYRLAQQRGTEQQGIMGADPPSYEKALHM